MDLNLSDVLHVVGGLRREGGILRYVEGLVTAMPRNPTQLIWMHRDYEREAGDSRFVCMGRAKRLDEGMIRDFAGAVKEILPLYAWLRTRKRVILHAHTRMGIMAAWCINRILRIPLVVHFHFLASRPTIYRFILRTSFAIPIFNSR